MALSPRGGGEGLRELTTEETNADDDYVFYPTVPVGIYTPGKADGTDCQPTGMADEAEAVGYV